MPYYCSQGPVESRKSLIAAVIHYLGHILRSKARSAYEREERPLLIFANEENFPGEAGAYILGMLPVRSEMWVYITYKNSDFIL